ncbi:hypothetical protein WKW77_24235 [Variovorax ureilyticus]|uniref:Uncharacterized protein n=1 Tax=Variovorax ureilyticus TaxID=1836198 RepID=A0ABU8VM33_9BURK
MQVEVTADVVKVDKKKHMITLRGTEYEVDLEVGDQVHSIYTEGVVLDGLTFRIGTFGKSLASQIWIERVVLRRKQGTPGLNPSAHWRNFR